MRRFAPIATAGPGGQPSAWKHITVADDGAVTVTSGDTFGGKTTPMAKPYTVAQLEALVWSGKWEELPV